MSKCACGGRVFEFFHDSSWDVLLNTLSKTCNGRYNGSQSSVLASLYVIIAGRGAHTRRFARSRIQLMYKVTLCLVFHPIQIIALGRQSYEVTLSLRTRTKAFVIR